MKVFPLVPGQKRPATANGCHDASTDQGQVHAWWKTTPYNVGIACGPSGLLVIDLDQPKPGTELPPEWHIPGVVDGTDVLAVVCEKAGQPMPWATRSVATPTGGMHLYFRAPEKGLPNTCGTLGPLIDTRGIGGYVVAPGSTTDSGSYATVISDPPVPLPRWLEHALSNLRPSRRATRANHQQTQATVLKVSQPLDDRTRRWVEAAVKAETKRAATARPHHRNHELFYASIALGQLVGGGFLALAEASLSLQQAADTVIAGDPDAYTPAEAQATINSGLHRGIREPRRRKAS